MSIVSNTYTSSGHCFGFFSLFPSFKYSTIPETSTSGYGVTPLVNNSQNTTPNDHCKKVIQNAETHQYAHNLFCLFR